MFLIESCRLAQNGETPLLVASWNGHATVVEQLLVAGGDTEAKGTVSGEREMIDADRAGSRGDTRRAVAPLFSCCGVFSVGFCI